MKWMTARALRTDNRVVMNSPDHPERQGTRHVLLSGLGVVLALLLALGVYSAGSLSNVSRAGTLTTREYSSKVNAWKVFTFCCPPPPALFATTCWIRILWRFRGTASRRGFHGHRQ